MFVHEDRSPQQISREAAERYAQMEGIAAQKAEAKRVRQQQRRRAIRAEPAEAH